MGHIDLTRRSFLFGNTAPTQKAETLSENESGATAIEYGLIGSLIGVALISALSLTGRRMRRPMNCARIAMQRAGTGMNTTPGACQRMQAK